MFNDRAGFILRSGKTQPLEAGQIHEQAVNDDRSCECFNNMLKRVIRYRIYKDHLVFESLQKRITDDQRKAMKRIVRDNDVGSMIVSIADNWREFSDFRRVKACVLDHI